MMSRQHEVANRVCTDNTTKAHQMQPSEKSKHTISNDELVEQCCFVD